MVIQRWQSLLLLVAAVMMGLFSFCTLAQVQTPESTLSFTCKGFSYIGEATDGAPSGTMFGTWYFFILSLTTAVVLLIDMFLYRNLTLQKKVCLIGLLMTVASFFTGLGIGSNALENVQQIDWTSVFYIAPSIAVAASLLAWHRMQSDHNKLRAVDRIR